MTVSTIGNVAPELKRTLENQNRPETLKREAEPAPGSARLPSDVVSASSYQVEEPVNLDEIMVQIQVQNREAARSTLSDDDLTALENQASPQERVLAQAKASVAAQTNKLPANLLDLLSE